MNQKIKKANFKHFVKILQNLLQTYLNKKERNSKILVYQGKVCYKWNKFNLKNTIIH